MMKINILKINSFLFEEFKKEYDDIPIDIHFPMKDLGHISINRAFLERRFTSIKQFEAVLSKTFIFSINVKEKFVDIILSPSFFSFFTTKFTHCFSLDESNNKPIHIEYCSANPVGKLHIGNMRNIVLGESIRKFISHFGGLNYHNTEYYINDMGNQIDILWNNMQQDIVTEYPDSIALLKANSINNMDKIAPYFCHLIKTQLDNLKVTFDAWVSEKDILQRYDKSEGFWNAVSKIALLENDRLYIDNGIRKCFLRKEDGSSTYLLRDFMYMYDKKQRGFLNQIVVLGFDHNEYIKSLLLFAKAINVEWQAAQTQHVYALLENEKVVFSKRNGVIKDPILYDTAYLFNQMTSSYNNGFIYFDISNISSMILPSFVITLNVTEQKGTMDDNVILFLFKFDMTCSIFAHNFEVVHFNHLFYSLHNYFSNLGIEDTLNIRLFQTLHSVFEFLTYIVFHKQGKLIYKT